MVSSFTFADAKDELEKLIACNVVLYNRELFGCCMKYCYNRDKLITNKLRNKFFTHLYTMSSNVKNKNMYIHSLTDDFKEINEGKSKAVEIDLKKINFKQAVRLVKQNIDDKKLAIMLGDDRMYMLNDNTINKLEKGLVDENALLTFEKNYGIKVSPSDEELVSVKVKSDKISLIVIEPEPDKDKKKKITGKTRPGGAFFKH